MNFETENCLLVWPWDVPRPTSHAIFFIAKFPSQTRHSSDLCFIISEKTNNCDDSAQYQQKQTYFLVKKV